MNARTLLALSLAAGLMTMGCEKAADATKARRQPGEDNGTALGAILAEIIPLASIGALLAIGTLVTRWTLVAELPITECLVATRPGRSRGSLVA